MDEIKLLHDEILQKVRRYYEIAHRPKQEAKFVPGETFVNYAGRVYDADEMTAAADAALEFFLTHGRYSRKFERKFAEYLGVRHALLVNSGSSANLLAFLALTSPLLGERRIRRGDEVITVACGFPTTVSPIVQFGAVPVFIDVQPDTVNLDPELLESALSPRTRAVMAAHTLGNPFDLRRVKEFCDRHGLFLVEDNCDALGSRFEGRLTGTWGDVATSSFYPPHHLTMGEGGAAYTSSELLHRIMLSFRDWGRECHCPSGADNSCGKRFSGKFGTLPEGYDHKYVYSHFGCNLKATDLQAAIGCAQLDKLDFFLERRRENHRYLREKLEGAGPFRLMKALPEGDPAWFGFLLTLDDDAPFSRNELTAFLEQNRIQTRNLFSGNLTRHPCFESLVPGRDYRVAGSLENTDKIMNDAFWIGVYPGMTREKLDFMAEKIREFCGK